MFTLHNDSGFHVELNNGFNISVQWSWSHYRTGRNLEKALAHEKLQPSQTAEVCVWNKQDKYVDLSNLLTQGTVHECIAEDKAFGFITAEDLAKIMYCLSGYETSDL